MWFINLTLYFLFIFFYTFWCRWMLKPLTGVLPICVLCLEMYRWTNKWDGHSWGDAPLPDHFLFSLGSFFLYLFILISFFSSYCVLFLFVLHVQFCKAKSRCALSQLFRQQRSLTVSFALTYNLTIFALTVLVTSLLLSLFSSPIFIPFCNGTHYKHYKLSSALCSS